MRAGVFSNKNLPEVNKPNSTMPHVCVWRLVGCGATATCWEAGAGSIGVTPSYVRTSIPPHRQEDMGTTRFGVDEADVSEDLLRTAKRPKPTASGGVSGERRRRKCIFSSVLNPGKNQSVPRDL